ncbi:Dual specificity protein phosphatase cdc14a, partial [Mortierella sp. GBA39]
MATAVTSPQTLRSIYLEDRSARAHPPSSTIQLTPRFDSITKQPIILWNDITKVFKSALYVLCQGASVPFLVNDQFEDLIPLRIALYPGQVLDVVLENPNPPGSALTMDAMQLPMFSPVAKAVLTPSPKAPQDYNNYDTGDIEGKVQELSIAPSAMGPRNPQTTMEAYIPMIQIEQQIQRLANKVLTTRCHESAGPSMFIVIPTATRSWGKSVPSMDRLRLFWLCECTVHSNPHPQQHGSSLASLRPHLYHHPALYINTADEFIEKYGAYSMLNLWMFTHDRTGRTDNSEHRIDYSEGLKVLQQALRLTKEQVELHLDTMISRLELAIPSSTFDKQQQKPTLSKPALEEYEDEDDCRANLVSDTIILDAAGLQELGKMIAQPDLVGSLGNNYTSNFVTSDEQAALAGHELYKSVAKDSIAQWICQSHYSEHHPTFDPEEFNASVKGIGKYTPQPNLLGCHLQSCSDFEALMKSKLVQSGCLIDLILQFSEAYTPTLKDWRMFREALRGIQLMHLVLAGPGLEAMTTAQVKSIFRTILDLQLESLSVGNAQFLLKHVQELWNTSKEQTYGLRYLWLSVEVQATAEDRDAMTNGFNNLILNSPDLQSVTLVWNDGAPFGQGELLLLALAYKSYIFRKSLKVAMGTQAENFDVMMDMGNYYVPEMTSTRLFEASQHFLALTGQLQVLAITEPIFGLEMVQVPLDTTKRQWDHCGDPDVVLFRILSKNKDMKRLSLACEVGYFEVMAGIVDQIRRDVLKGGGECELKSLTLEDKAQQAKKTFTCQVLDDIDREASNVCEFMEDQLYFMWTAINPISTRRTTYLTIDNYLQYTAFFSDFGPFDIADVFRFCCLMKERLEMLLHDMTPEEAYVPVEYIHPSINSFRDAGCGPVTYTLSILDCLRGLRKGLDQGLLRLDKFNVKEYEHYERVSNGDFNWITPFFIAFAGPKDKMKREALLRHDAIRAAAGMSTPSEDGSDETDSSSKFSFPSSSSSSQKSSAESSRSSTPPSTQSSTGSEMSIGSGSHSGGSSSSGSGESQQNQEATQMECPLSISMEASSIDAKSSTTPPQQQQVYDSESDVAQRVKRKKQRTRLNKSFRSVLGYFSTHNVQCIIRLNDKTYDKAHFTARGIEHVDMIYPDGTCPPWYIVERFFEVCERVAMDHGGVVAIHCMAGLGRTGTLIGAYLMRHFDMTARETIAFLRLMRPGSVVGPQQNWLAENEWRIRKRDYQHPQSQQPQNGQIMQSVQEERQKEIHDRLLKMQQSHGLTPKSTKSSTTATPAGSTIHTPGTNYEQVFSRANSEGLESTWSEVADEAEGGSLTVLDGDDDDDDEEEGETSGFEDMTTTEDESMEESNIAEDTDEDEEGGEYGLDWDRISHSSSLLRPSPLRAQHPRRVSIGSLDSLMSAFERDSVTDDGQGAGDGDVDMGGVDIAAATVAVTPEVEQPSLLKEHIGNSDYIIPGQPRKQDLSLL